MSQTLKAGIVRFNRPVLIGGSAILGVAVSNLMGSATVKSALLAAGAICLMYVGDVGRAASDRVARLLPSEASTDVVRSTQAHNLGSKGRATAIVLVAAVGLACLAGAMVASIAGDSREGTSKLPPLGIRAPSFYAAESVPLTVHLACPSSCTAAVYSVGSTRSPIIDLLVQTGYTKVRLPKHVLAALGEERRVPMALGIRLDSPGWASIGTRVRLARKPPDTNRTYPPGQP